MDAPSDERHGGCPNCARLEREVRELREQVRALTARLNRDSSNSHKPPSSDPPWAPPPSPAEPPTGRKPGGQAGHPPHRRLRLPAGRVDRVVDHRPRACARCGAALPRDGSPGDPAPSWHQVAELPAAIVAVVTEHRGHARACPACGHVTRCRVPAAVRARVLGPRLAGLASYLTGRCHLGRRVVQEVLADVFGVPLALGSVSNYEARTSDALAEAHAGAWAAARRAPVRHVDETGWKLAGRARWLWTAVIPAAPTATTRSLACFAVRGGRNWAALCGLLGRRAGKGVVTSDRWHAYSRIGTGRRQVCWAHLKRDFQKWADAGGPTALLGQDGLGVCRDVFALWRDFRQRHLTRRQLQRRLGPPRRRLRAVLTWNLSCGDRAAAAFCRRLLACEPALWTFSRVGGVEPTNNAAERALRPAVLWRKNSFGCHGEGGLRFAERMLTAVTTLRLQHRPVLAWLQDAVTAHRAGLPRPLLC